MLTNISPQCSLDFKRAFHILKSTKLNQSYNVFRNFVVDAQSSEIAEEMQEIVRKTIKDYGYNVLPCTPDESVMYNIKTYSDFCYFNAEWTSSMYDLNEKLSRSHDFAVTLYGYRGLYNRIPRIKMLPGRSNNTCFQSSCIHDGYFLPIYYIFCEPTIEYPVFDKTQTEFLKNSDPITYFRYHYYHNYINLKQNQDNWFVAPRKILISQNFLTKKGQYEVRQVLERAMIDYSNTLEKLLTVNYGAEGLDDDPILKITSPLNFDELDKTETIRVLH